MNLINYIIPVCKLGDNDYQYRINNLKYIFENFLSKQKNIKIKLIIIEQSIDGDFYFIEKFYYPKNIMVKELTCKYPVFNKCWLNNIAAKYADGEHIIFAETDVCSISDYYFYGLFNHISKLKLNWCIGWNKLNYMRPDKNITHILKEGKGAEGGIVYFNRSFFNKIGCYNEWIESLGGVDNDIAARATFMSKYNSFPEAIYHRWHPDSIAKKIDNRRKKNIAIVNHTKQNPKKVIELLKSHDNGKTDRPVCNENYCFKIGR